MGYPIYHSQYTAAQIEAAIGKGPRVNASGYWEVWNISTSAYESTGVGAGVQPPTVVTQASQMTNHGYVYIYNGSEAGYTAGYWYYWNGSAWTAGGAYQVAATDPTLTVAGAAADAKATGDAVGELKSALYNGIEPILSSNPPFYDLFKRDIDGEYLCNFNINDYKAETRVLYYVDPVNGSDSNAGTHQRPLKKVSTAYAKEDVTDIVLYPGVYTMNEWFTSGGLVEKSISISTILGGMTKYISGVAGNFSEYDAENHIYRMYSTNSGGVIDIASKQDNGNYFRFASGSADSLSDGQYYTADSYVYIRCDSGIASKQLYVLKNDRFGLTFKPTNGGTLTVENVEFIGGACPVDIRCLDATGTAKTYGFFYNCKFTNAIPSSMWESSNGLNSLSATTFCYKCESAYNYDDGFCYHKYTAISSNLAPIAGEYMCKGHHNGVTSGTDNGSTVHDGGRAIRVSCEYYNNIGPNVADVHTGTVTWNYGVNSHDAQQVANYAVTQESARMILVDCIASGADIALKVGNSGTSNSAYVRRPHMEGALDKASSSVVVFS